MKSLFNIKPAETICFTTKPLPLCTKSEIKEVSTTEINKLMSAHRGHSFEWTNNVYVRDTWVLTDEDNLKLQSLLSKCISMDSFSVCFIDKRVGHGVFTRKKILKGSIIFYEGIEQALNHENLIYGIAASDGYAINGAKKGGFAALFQDLYPPNVVLEGLPFSVARNNFIAKKLKLSFGSITYFEAICDIPPLSQCGLAYGTYWKEYYAVFQKEKLFFSEKGEVIDGIFAEYIRLMSLTKQEVKEFQQTGSLPGSNEFKQIVRHFAQRGKKGNTPEALVKVSIVDDKRKLIKSCLIKNKQQELLELRNMIGKDIIKKLSFEETYEISIDYLKQVDQVNPKGIEQLAEILEITTSELREQIISHDKSVTATIASLRK